MKLEALNALKGDSFLLSWNNEENHILIDSGTIGTYKNALNRKLRQINKLEAVIISHVDYDHIGGFVRLMSIPRPPVESNYDIFINTPDLILSPNTSENVGYKHGIQLDIKLAQKKIKPKGLYLGSHNKNIVYIKGLKLQILSPSEAILQELKKHWTAEKLYEKYLEETKVSSTVGNKYFKLDSYEDIIKAGENPHKWKKDLVNSSSIAFIAEYNNKSILFLADANPSEIEKELRNLEYNEDDKLTVDLVKISHHGSKFNTSKGLLEIINCDSYLISTNGRGPYYHPHRETIVRIAEYSRKDRNTRLNIYTNYNLEKKKFIKPEEEIEWNLNIEQRNQFDL